MSYILVTPSKDEEVNLPKLIQSVMGQTIKPLVWVIIDDGSTDNTPVIIEKAKERYKWIRSIRVKEHSRDLSAHYAYVCNTGFDLAIKYSEANNLQYDYIGLLDADMILGREFYSKLIKEFERSPKLGIASGSIYYDIDGKQIIVYYDIDGKQIIENDRDDLPPGGMRLWRRECFEETGRGLYPGYSADAVSNVLAKLRGWEMERFDEIRAVQARRTSSAEGLWKGYKYHGESAYFRNYHPLFVLAKGIRYIFGKPHYIGIAFLYGYLSGVIRRIGKIDNKEVRNYYYHQKYKEVVEYYKNKLRKKIKAVNKRS